MIDLRDPDFEARSPLAQCVAVSRRLGADPSLVLHGGGNTSVKDTVIDITGEPVEVVHVKGSGWNLETIEEAGFAPLRRQRLIELSRLDTLSDTSLVNELKQASLSADAPAASIEAVLHAIIPSKFVLHTHADAIVTLTNQVDGRATVLEALSDELLVLDYVKPGFELARHAATAWAAAEPDRIHGLVLMNHGLFTFGATAREAYEKHLELVDRARSRIRAAIPRRATAPLPRSIDPTRYSRWRAELSRLAGRPLLLHRRPSAEIDALLEAPGFPDITRRGTITPEHVIYTKRLPCVDEDFEAYAEQYLAYFDRQSARHDQGIAPLDPAPRVILSKDAGLVTAGVTPGAARIAADIYEHTAGVILDAEGMGRYQSLDEEAAFDIEYWELEQRKLRSASAAPALQGQVALVTGAASELGRAAALALLEAGASVIALDRSVPASAVDDDRWFSVACDESDANAVNAAVDAGVLHFGGIDICIRIAAAPASNPCIAQAVKPYLAQAFGGGRLIVVPWGVGAELEAPDAGAIRAVALEWASAGVRLNAVIPTLPNTPSDLPGILAARVARIVRDLCMDHHSTTMGARICVGEFGGGAQA